MVADFRHSVYLLIVATASFLSPTVLAVLTLFLPHSTLPFFPEVNRRIAVLLGCFQLKVTESPFFLSFQNGASLWEVQRASGFTLSSGSSSAALWVLFVSFIFRLVARRCCIWSQASELSWTISKEEREVFSRSFLRRLKSKFPLNHQEI